MFSMIVRGSDCVKIVCLVFIKILELTDMEFFNSIPLHMDYDGQRKSEAHSRIIVTLFGVVGLIWGYIIQQFSQTVYIVGAGFLLAAIVTIPPWPIYREEPLPWQKSRTDADAQEPQSQQPKSKKKK